MSDTAENIAKNIPTLERNERVATMRLVPRGVPSEGHGDYEESFYVLTVPFFLEGYTDDLYWFETLADLHDFVETRAIHLETNEEREERQKADMAEAQKRYKISALKAELAALEGAE